MGVRRFENGPWEHDTAHGAPSSYIHGLRVRHAIWCACVILFSLKHTKLVTGPVDTRHRHAPINARRAITSPIAEIKEVSSRLSALHLIILRSGSVRVSSHDWVIPAITIEITSVSVKPAGVWLEEAAYVGGVKAVAQIIQSKLLIPLLAGEKMTNAIGRS